MCIIIYIIYIVIHIHHGTVCIIFVFWASTFPFGSLRFLTRLSNPKKRWHFVFPPIVSIVVPFLG